MKLKIFITLLSLMFLPASVMAQNGLRIAAVVNDEIISYYDLNARLMLIIVTSNLSNSPNIRQRLAPQILRTLIDEKLKMQEAKRMNIRVSEKEISKALKLLSQQNKIPEDRLFDFLARNGIDQSTLLDQIEADISWYKIINRIQGQTSKVSQEEIDEKLALIQANTNKSETRFSEIFLPVDSPEKEREVQELANRLLEQVRSGASFSSLARSFSQAPSASAGGDVGWVKKGQIDPKLETALTQLKKGMISNPISSSGGYYILAVTDRRIEEGQGAGNIIVSLQQLLIPLSPTASKETVNQQMVRARNLVSKVTNCNDMERVSQEHGSPLSGSLGKVNLKNLPDKMLKLIQPLQPGQPSSAVRISDGIAIFMVCEKIVEKSSVEDLRNKIANSLTVQRQQSVARRKMRDLRHAAFLDVRL
ncbi:MAG: peptidylprolyl isomerase [Rhodospirillales bacterium]|nr:peptidylprolyl isomerase [Rhodospirillales bacterium]